MRRKHRVAAFGLAVALHLMLLAVLPKSGGALDGLQPPILISLGEGSGPTLGSAPAPIAKRATPAVQPTASEQPSEPVARPAPEAPPIAPEQQKPERTIPVESPLPTPPPAPAADTGPDLTAEPVEPEAADALLSELDARLAGAASATSVSSILTGLSGSGDRCGLAAALQGMLQADVEVAAALSRIPRESRSVANAMMLWDGAWVEARAVDGSDGLLPVRRAIEQGVRTAPVSCREEVIRGPLFLAITAQPGTTLLALGSGAWRWSDLLRPAPPDRIDSRPQPQSFFNPKRNFAAGAP